jgi:PAS domain S-box-containing protein
MQALELLSRAVALNELSCPDTSVGVARGPSAVPADWALCLLEPDGRVSDWLAGAELLYGCHRSEVLGHRFPLFGSQQKDPHNVHHAELSRTVAQGHTAMEDWHVKKDGSRFWANVITMALMDEHGRLQGFARVVRDFTHLRDAQLRSASGSRPLQSAGSTVVGIISGELDHIPEANQVFLDLVGYTREDLTTGQIHWPDLTPPEYSTFDGHAHEECLKFGACTPFEKELIRKDGTRIPVSVATAMLSLVPFRWITFVQDLRNRNTSESVEQDEGKGQPDFGEIVGNSAALLRVLRQVELVAPTDATVLILGETGTGKELIARAIHQLSPRRHRPCITLNCAAIPTGLLESELFGYERGAFTGALSQKIGRFEMANQGTLFLDEVGDIPLDLQPKLLRALQEKSFERLGGTKTIPIDVRLVAVTNRNLTQMMGDRLFRSDLYYRLKVFPITLPALRDRPEDIPILARHFTKKYSEQMGRHIETIPSDTMDVLVNWSWPGNIRELENFIERAVILSSGASLRAPLAEIRKEAVASENTATLDQMEREYILKVFRECGGVVTTTATRLGLHRTTLNALMRKLGVSRADL